MKVRVVAVVLGLLVLVVGCSDEPEDAADYRIRGRERQSKGDLGGAIEDYDRSIELDPRNAMAYNYRGWVRTIMGDLDGAMEDYDRAIEVDPRYALAYQNRGFVRQKKGDRAGAIADFQKTLEVAPANWPHRGRVEEMLETAHQELGEK